MPQGKIYRLQPKQKLNGPGNFCRVVAGNRSNEKDAGGGRFRRRPEDSKYADTILSYCLYC